MDAPAGQSKRFLMRHLKNMQANGPRARSGQNTESYIVLIIYFAVPRLSVFI